jgi:hypothetical protein
METPTPEKRAIVPGDRVTFSLAGKTHKGTATSVYVAVNRKWYVTISAQQLRRAEYRRLLSNVTRAANVYTAPPTHALAEETFRRIDANADREASRPIPLADIPDLDYEVDLWGPPPEDEEED